MNRRKFESVLILLVPQVIEKIVLSSNIDELEAAKLFYNSKLYALLEDEETKLWHLSPMMLATMFAEEQATGDFTIPEEA